MTDETQALEPTDDRVDELDDETLVDDLAREDGDLIEPSNVVAPPTQAVSEKDIERATKSLEREATRHANRVSEIMGEDAQSLAKCPLCEPTIPGFLFAPSNVDEAAALLEQAAQGFGLGEPQLREAQDARRCDVCDGWGEVGTGSRVQTAKAITCGNCKGRGWIGPAVSRVQREPFETAGNGQEPAPPVQPEQTEKSPAVLALEEQGFIVIPPVQVPSS